MPGAPRIDQFPRATLSGRLGNPHMLGTKIDAEAIARRPTRDVARFDTDANPLSDRIACADG